MAYRFKRKRSPYWWVGFKDQTGANKQETTHCRIGVPNEERRSRQIVAKKSLEELSNPNIAAGWSWVSSFFETTYKPNPVTLERYLSAWATIQLFLEDKKLTQPGQLTRRHCFDYMQWRSDPEPKRGKYPAVHNTALFEIKVLRIVMQEAMERDLCNGNPCVKLGLKKQAPKVKPDMSAQIIELIRSKIAAIGDPKEREFFHLSFEIARYQGCRLKETSLNPMTDVDIIVTERAGKKTKTGKIRFLAKGSGVYGTLLHPELIPIFEELKTQERTYTWRTPPDRGRQWASGKWFRFLRDIGLKGSVSYTFHCTRVTVATEMFRNNVPENKAMQYVGHASTTTHRIYQRGTPDDLAECVQAIK